MKKFLIISLLAIVLLGINSCAEKGCTNASAPNYNSSATSDNGTCIDLTANIVGSYTGTYEDSTINGSVQTLYTQNQQITVTKIDDSHVQIVSPASTGFDGTFNATVTSNATVGGYLLTVTSQTSSTGTIITAYPEPDNGITFNGGVYITSQRELVIAVYAGVTDIEEFAGTH